MRVADVMSPDVITVTPEASIEMAARLLVNHGISGLPVVDDQGNLVGIITERDLILRQKARERTPWWKTFFLDAERLARDYRKAQGTTVGEVMTSPVVHVAPDTPIAVAAAILDQLRIGRLPVLAEDRLVGIVSRADLVKALASVPAAKPAAVSDTDLVRAMRERLRSEPWVSNRNIAVRAEGGVVGLYGLVESEAERAALETMARSIPGCQGVDTRLIVRGRMPSAGAV
jgi:CBS domain-containing protein